MNRIELSEEQAKELALLEAQAKEGQRQVGALLLQLRRLEAAAMQIEQKRDERGMAVLALHGIDMTKPENGTWQLADNAFVRVA